MTIDKPYVSRASGKARQTLHRVLAALKARRNGVVTFFGVFQNGKTLQVSARNTKPGKTHVSRTLMIGPRGGLSIVTNGKRRYLKARDLGRGSK